VFVPRFYDEERTVVDGGDPGKREAYLDAVFSDTTLVTQIAPVPGTDGLSWSTSSSTMPSLMARMLELLDVTDTDRVLEIGTGTGYNAALLCHRLTDARVASVDIDPTLVTDARDRLMSPRLPAAPDGRGRSGRRPRRRPVRPDHRHLCRVHRPPGLDNPARRGRADPRRRPWGDRRKPCGAAPYRRTLRARAVPGLPWTFHVATRRSGNPLRDGGTYSTVLSLDGARHRTTTLDPASLDQPDLRFVLQLLAPDVLAMYRTTSDGTDVVHLRTDDASWAEVGTTPRNGRYSVTEGGARSIWATPNGRHGSGTTTANRPAPGSA
jgi:SAM-dependent methyltransferase